MGRDSDRRRRRPSHSSSRDARPVVQRDDVRPSIESDYNYHTRPARSTRSTVMPQPPAPPKAASAYAAPPSASRSYRTRRGDVVYETEIPRSAYMSGGGGGSSGRRRRKSELSADEKYRQMRVSTGLTSSSDQESEEESDDEVLNRTSDIDEESESESESEEESDESSPTRRKGQRRDGQILSNRRQLPEPEQESSDDSDHDQNGAQLARTPSNSSGPPEGHYRTPESQRRRQRLIEAPPASMPRAETLPFQKTPPRRKPERRRAQSEILDAQPPRSIRHSSRQSDPVILQQKTSPRKPKKQASRGDSLRSNSNHRSSVLSSIISGSSGHGPSSGKRSKRPKERQHVQTVECVACCDEIKAHKAYTLKCDHHMCQDCIIRPFEMSLKDPKEMPPRCCTQRISLRHVEDKFDVKFKKKWNRKYEEYTTDNRLYCPNQRCADWIHPSMIEMHKGRPRAKCRCGTKVCVDCNGIWHSSSECPQDEDLQAFLKQAKEEGWKRCYKCKIMVDRKEGCNHMTCRCGAEFCMLCGCKWKSCDCEWFNFEPIDEVNDYYNNGPGQMDDIFDSDDPPPTRRRTHSQQIRRRQAQENHDAELARRLQYDMTLENESDEDENDDAYHMSGETVGLGIAPGHHDQYRTTSNIGRHRTRMRGSPVSYEHSRRSSGHKTPPRSLYDRGGYVTEVNRKRGLRGSERGDRGDSRDSMERRLADRLSEQRVSSGPPMHMGGYAPSHMSPAMMSQPVPPPPPMGYQPQLRMPMHSMPMPNSPPMMNAPPPHAFGSFPPHQPVPIHHHHSQPRGVMPDFDDEQHPRASAITAGLASGGGNNRVAEWMSHVADGPPEEKLSRRPDDRLARVS